MSTNADGATVNPHAEAILNGCPNGNGPGRQGQHHNSWVSPSSDLVKCSTCGQVCENTSESDKVLVAGKVVHVDPV